MSKTFEITRRTALQGIGTAVALPLLDAMLPSLAKAAADGAKPPTRMAFVYVPNGKHMQDWTPKAEGAKYDLPWILEPLQPSKDDFCVLTGLTHQKAAANGDGGGDHARALTTFLTGTQARKTHGADIRAGVSVDQVAAREVGQHTRFASLEIGCDSGAQSGNCDSGYSCAYSCNIAWKSETSPLVKENNPRLVFERLFASGRPGESAADRAKRERYNKSVLDLVQDDAKKLQRRLGVVDQRKLDEYLTGVRDLERRIAMAGKNEEGSSAAALGMKTPSGVPADYGEHIRLMQDIMALAFQTDTTRVTTFVVANEGSNRSYAFLGAPEGHHDLSHHGNDAGKHEKIRKINRFHIEQFAHLLTKLKGIKEGNGTLLDNCMLIYGSGISDGDRHNHDDLPILLAGKGAGTVKPGRHVKYAPGTPLTNLYLAMLDRMQVRCDHLGDSTGRLSKLDG